MKIDETLTQSTARETRFGWYQSPAERGALRAAVQFGVHLLSSLALPAFDRGIYVGSAECSNLAFEIGIPLERTIEE